MATAPANTTRSPATMILFFAAKVAPGLILAVQVPTWLALFGTSAYGRFAVIWAVAGMVSSLATGWMQQAVLRGSGDTTWSLRRIFSSPQTLRRITGLYLAAVLLCAALGMQLHGWASAAAAGAALTLATAPYTVILAQLQRSGLPGLYAVVEILRPLVSFVSASLVGVMTNSSPAGSAMVMVLASALGLAVSTGTAVVCGCRALGWPSLAQRLDISPVRSYWQFGWPLSLWLLLSTALATMDRLVVAALLGEAAAGTYAGVADLVWRGIPIVAFPITMTLHPELMRLWNSGSRQDALVLLRLWTKRLTLVLGCVSLVVVVLGAPVLNRVLPGSPATRPLVLLLAVGVSAWQVALLAHKRLEFVGRTRTMLAIMIGAVVLTAVVDLGLVPIFGLPGAAAGAVAGATAYLVGVLRLGRSVS